MHSTAPLSLCRELVERCLPETPRSAALIKRRGDTM